MAKYRMDLTDGPVLKKLLLFTVPIILTNVLQQLYHAADMMVVGNFATESTKALAAVGATVSVTNLCLNLFIGLSIGANVVCANLFGAGKREELRRAMHTSLLLAAVSGVAIAIFGFAFSRRMLEGLSTPDSVLDQATLYMRIIFLGQPGSLIYNFGAGILRANGDTRRPMFILSGTGILNCLLNLLFVIGFHLDAAGVALATVAAQYVSAALILFLLFSPKGDFALSLSQLRFSGTEGRRIIAVGVPCGLNGMVFSLSNVIIVSALNVLGEATLAANSAASNIDALLYQVLYSFSSACVSFSGQCFGAGRYRRIDRLLGACILLSAGLVIAVDILLLLFPGTALGFFTKDPEVARLGLVRMLIICGAYPIYTISENCTGCIRGMGHSTSSSVLNMFLICVPRVIWVLFVFPLRPDYRFLLLCYPISWLMSSLAQVLCYFYYRRKLPKEEVPVSP